MSSVGSAQAVPVEGHSAGSASEAKPGRQLADSTPWKGQVKQIVVLAAEGRIAVVETSSVLGTVKLMIEVVDRSSSSEANQPGLVALTAARAFPLE